MSSIKNSAVGLPTLIDNKYIRNQVQRRIKNKLQPLAYKYFVLKSGRCLTNLASKQSVQQSFHNNNQFNIQEKLKNRKTEYKQCSKHEQKDKQKDKQKQKNKQKQKILSKNKNKSKIEIQRRRKAVVQACYSFDKQHFKELQTKVQHHIMLKRMDIMENQFTYAQQCGKKQKQKMCKDLRTSPIQKFVILFEKSQRPSQKIHRVKQSSCQQMLKQIKSAKSIKHIECIQQNMRNLINNDILQSNINKNNKKSRQRQRQKHGKNRHVKINQNTKNKQNQVIDAIKSSKKEQKKLKQEILKDIKKQYEIQGSSKIRININHKKMIQIM